MAARSVELSVIKSKTRVLRKYDVLVDTLTERKPGTRTLDRRITLLLRVNDYKQMNRSYASIRLPLPVHSGPVYRILPSLAFNEDKKGLKLSHSVQRSYPDEFIIQVVFIRKAYGA
jgi:hypothetical protein